MPSTHWSRADTLVAFALYCKLPFGRLHARNPEVIRVAAAIGRTPAAVAMKCVNLASLDENHARRGVRGLSNVSRLDRAVWADFQSSPEMIGTEAAQAINQLTERTISTGGVTDNTLDTGREQERLVRVRVNQWFFRNMILASYATRCAVCGLGLRQLMVAAHIVPWAVDQTNRMNPRNGLCLCGTHDLAFEKGVLLITRDGTIEISAAFISHRGSGAADDWLFRYHGRRITLPERWPPDPELLGKRHDMG